MQASGSGGGGSSKQSSNSFTNTSVTFDRKHVVSCQCSCQSQAEWCSHVVALCLHRITHPSTVKFRAPGLCNQWISPLFICFFPVKLYCSLSEVVVLLLPALRLDTVQRWAFWKANFPSLNLTSPHGLLTKETSLGIKTSVGQKLNEKNFAVDQTCPWPLSVRKPDSAPARTASKVRPVPHRRAPTTDSANSPENP